MEISTSQSRCIQTNPCTPRAGTTRLCTTARKAERLLAATKAQDLVNMDRQHGGQAKGAKARTNREQVRVKSESLDGGDYDFDCDDEDSPENAVQGSACSYCRRRPPSRMKAQVVVTLCSDRRTVPPSRQKTLARKKKAKSPCKS